MKRYLFLLLAACMLLSALSGAVLATEPSETEPERAANACGDGITWAFADGVLTITGDGEMDDFEKNAAPWQAHMDEIEEVLIEGKLTYIGAYAFTNCDSLLAVSFGDALYEIGPFAFNSCDGLESIWLPASFKVFGEGSFQSCKNLKEIHCSGRFPSFRQNSMWETYVTIFYPAEKPWNTETIAQLEQAFKGRVEFLASDGTDHYDPTEPPTEPAPTETVPETTAPEIVPPTEPESVETEPPVTEEATEPMLIMPKPTEAPATEAPTEPIVTQPLETPSVPTGLIIVGAVLAGLALGALIFGRKKGKYAR